ncbi:MAG: ArsS family sensor histidine kinase [Sulfuricurvum sp.]|uniref:ArsS family sensor histidine kinase n=1 Tax=Sulfuricurvum sp. TaxID=2025608 RepID=UPI002618977E|nr:ArsS family sensor histidine kinase [Sulfuricurvum sp.]MDD2829921.1 ArsS family sensor histidine kinase [Sulfuricurvum sp.]MDD4949589.1 ArsS family sensor histidine kinase [Sulfuricurvum sp.]
MSINKHSILTLISLFFVLIFLLINGLFWIALEHFAREYEIQQHHRFHFEPQERMLLDHKPFPIFAPPPPPPLSVSLKSSALFPIWIVFITIDLLILAFYGFLLKKLSPLHRLKEAIIHFQEGDTKLNVPIKSKDEISQITSEFNQVLEKIAALKEARSLFLRNILHELKTPIMKGSLTADCLNESIERERLIQIFSRMNYHLDEFSKMEQFSSGEWKLNLQEYRFVDILDHACDILLCDKKSITIKGEDSILIINADFELFAIALKNLIDNAFKYSDETPTLIILSHSIEICSVGEPLSDANHLFSKPFNRTYESSVNGLGLGLYITNSILNKHGFKLKYQYNSGLNCFKIILNS